MNRARLNHILLPSTFAGRERLRRSLLGKLLSPLGWIFGALTREGRIAGLLLLFVGTAALDVVSTPIYLLWCGLVGIVTGSLVARITVRLKAVKVEVRVGDQVTVGQPLTMDVVLHNTGQKDVHALRVSGPFLPWDGRWLASFPGTATLRAGEKVRLSTRALFVQRGPHHLDRFSVGALVPFGLALGPRQSSDSVRFTVVPRLATVQQLTLPQGMGQNQRNAKASVARVGQALELFGVRPYRAGDSLRNLHPRTWARTGKPHVREYVQEQFTSVAVVVDIDARGVSERTHEAVLSLAAGVVARLQQTDVLVDQLSVGAEVRSYARRRSGAVLSESLNLLAMASQQSAISDAALFERVQGRLAHVGAVIVISAQPRDGLAELLRSRGCAAKLLRVHQPRKAGFFRTSAPPLTGQAEVVSVNDIEQGKLLRL